MKISVFGLGKAGLTLACVMADCGYNVIGVDVNKTVVDKINGGDCPIENEPGLPELVKKHAGKNLIATTDGSEAVKEADMHVILVPLFIDENKKPDFSIIKDVAEVIGKDMKRDDAVVLETTAPVGTTGGTLKEILEKESGLKAGSDFLLAHSPERIMSGYAISRFKEFKKVVGGINEKSTDAVSEIYSRFCQVTKVRSLEAAELTKIVEGIYRDVNIALANEICKICDEYGLDFQEIREASKNVRPNSNFYVNILEAGLGVGGHCIPVYPHFILKDAAINEKDKRLIEMAREVNDSMVDYFFKKVVGKLEGENKKIKGSNVAVLGLTFREDVKETAYTRSKPFIELLKSAGANVYGFDPLLSEDEIEREFGVEKLNDVESMDCVVIVNKSLEFVEMCKNIGDKIVDCKNFLRGK